MAQCRGSRLFNVDGSVSVFWLNFGGSMSVAHCLKSGQACWLKAGHLLIH